jgi:hypothetical protein
MNDHITEKASADFRFGTKAKTLSALRNRVTKSNFCDQIEIDVAEWANNRGQIVDTVTNAFAHRMLAVRSSAAGEDAMSDSQAGVNLSLIGIPSTTPELAAAIDQVFDSYRTSSSDDQVLVQPMVADVAVSGVVLTRDLDSGSPYYVINYDDFSGRTDTVTSGVESKAVLVRRAAANSLHSPRFIRLIECVAEIETATGHNELDIEFCITKDGEVYVLQVRPLAAGKNWTRIPDGEIDAAVARSRDLLNARNTPRPDLAGANTVFGEMPDWNPAEIIGNAPRPLAFSLYRKLITDRIWAVARADMGYRLVDQPLIVSFSGRPYVDVRLSFNSFLPPDLDPAFAAALVDFQLDILRQRRDLHDKIEFEIAVTCRDFAFPAQRRRLLDAGFGAADVDRLEAGLHDITGTAITSRQAELAADLERARRLLDISARPAGASPLQHADALLAACRKDGTLPFSKLARHGFIGVLFLRSLVARGVFTTEEADGFMHGIRTVASDLVTDMQKLHQGAITQADFLHRYGHLRPGTYDILSQRYDERPDLYLGHADREMAAHPEVFHPTAAHLAAIDELLAEAGYDLPADELLAYIVDAVKAREESKFAFTRCISDALVALTEWGESVGLSRDDISYLEIGDILGGDTDALAARVDDQRHAHGICRAIRLPHLIRGAEDLDVVGMPLGHPTFITNQTVTARGLGLTAREVRDIDGAIVLIESADPGFDWVFSHDIKGLVTCYGGANSHMAIRCAEFGLPAAIGCGERLFEQLAGAAVIELNCGARTVKPLKH